MLPNQQYLNDLPPSYEEAMRQAIARSPQPKNHIEISTISRSITQTSATRPDVTRSSGSNRFPTTFQVSPRRDCSLAVESSNRTTQNQEYIETRRMFQWRKIFLIYAACVFVVVLFFNALRNYNK